MNYYNENDPKAAAWLRELINAGAIPPGDVDERSIEDVRPSDLAGYTQCHFFAGIAGWSHALALAGWPSSRPVWTGSCPCQPFSAAGKGAGFDDQRHLWPAWFHLIRECRPAAVFGEQVASKAADPWIDLVHADLEGMGYAFGCVPFPAAGVGAPHIRDRNYWVANPSSQGLSKRERVAGVLGGTHGADARKATIGTGVLPIVGMADTNGRYASAEREQRGGEQRFVAQDGGAIRLADSEQYHSGCETTAADHRKQEGDGSANQCGGRGGSPVRLADSNLIACRQGRAIDGGRNQGSDAESRPGHGGSGVHSRPGPVNGFWRAADWLGCRGGKWRPVEPGTFPLGHGLPARVGRLRGYGNAIVPQQAAEFVIACAETMQEQQRIAA